MVEDGQSIASPPASTITSVQVARREQRLRSRGWLLRVGIAVALVVAVALAEASSLRLHGYTTAFAWVPLVGAVDAWRRRRPASDAAAALAAVLDLGLLASTVVLVPATAPAALLALVALASYWFGVRPRVGAATTFLLTVAVGASIVGVAHVDATSSLVLLLGLSVAAGGAVWLEAERQRHASSVALDLATESGRHAALLQGVGEAVVVTGPGGRVRQFNAAAAVTFGCSSDDAVGGRCHDVLGLHRDLVDLDCSSGCPLVRADANGDQQVWRSLPTGQRQPLLASAFAVEDANGNTIEVVHSFRDITELKRAEEAKTMFLAATSHELRTPLTVIQGFAEILRRDELTPGERDLALQTIDARTAQLGRIVDRLLMSARIESGRVALDLEPVDLAPVLKRHAEDITSASERAVTIDLPGDAPRVHAASTALDTVLDHLIENAVKYSPDGGPIELTAEVGDEHVDLHVRDHGLGMGEEELAHCFDRFWQAQMSEVRRFGGTGIGLYIVKSLVEAMHGEITVQSALGEGTRFTVSLRRADAIATDATETTATVGGERTMIEEFMRQVGVGRAGGR